jgi:hypothetical protein
MIVQLWLTFEEHCPETSLFSMVLNLSALYEKEGNKSNDRLISIGDP